MILTLPVAGLLAAVHLLTPRFDLRKPERQARWMSFAGGVAAAYVFLHLLPDLARHGADMPGENGMLAYALALAGLAVFYGLERAAQAAQRRGAPDQPAGWSRAGPGMFWAHVAAFSGYNMLIGVLLIERDAADIPALILHALALGLHLFVNDLGLHRHHRDLYDARGRWILALAVLAGWGIGALGLLPAFMLSASFAFLTGALILNVLKEEIPDDSTSRLGPFLVGAAGYAALLAFA